MQCLVVPLRFLVVLASLSALAVMLLVPSENFVGAPMSSLAATSLAVTTLTFSSARHRTPRQRSPPLRTSWMEVSTSNSLMQCLMKERTRLHTLMRTHVQNYQPSCRSAAPQVFDLADDDFAVDDPVSMRDTWNHVMLSKSIY